MEIPNEYPILYHYTDMNGLLGILEKKIIYATDIRFLNDSFEFLYALGLAQSALRNIYISKDDTQISFRNFREFFSSQILIPSFWNDILIFVSSFSAEKDILSQWRGYCPEGNGFCIGFNFNKPSLKNLITHTEDSLLEAYHLMPCEYIKEGDINPFSRSIIPAYDAYLHPQPGVNPLDDAVHTFITDSDFYRMIPILKHPKFSEEAEWRLVFLQNLEMIGNIKYRPGRNLIKQYIEIELNDGTTKPDYIEEIIIGPTQNTDLSIASLENLLIKNGYSYQGGRKINRFIQEFEIPKLIKSKVPYRPL